MLVSAAQSESPIEMAMSMMQGASAVVTPDLSFTVKGVVPNRYRATVNVPGVMFGDDDADGDLDAEVDPRRRRPGSGRRALRDPAGP